MGTVGGGEDRLQGVLSDRNIPHHGCGKWLYMCRCCPRHWRFSSEQRCSHGTSSKVEEDLTSNSVLLRQWVIRIVKKNKAEQTES